LNEEVVISLLPICPAIEIFRWDRVAMRQDSIMQKSSVAKDIPAY
jgi:hypothetical protein